MKAVALPDVLIVVGSVFVAAGLAAYDWRLALIACGGLLLAGGIVGILRGK